MDLRRPRTSLLTLPALVAVALLAVSPAIAAAQITTKKQPKAHKRCLKRKPPGRHLRHRRCAPKRHTSASTSPQPVSVGTAAATTAPPPTAAGPTPIGQSAHQPGPSTAPAGESPSEVAGEPAAPQEEGPIRLFSATSPWNAAVPDSAPLDPSSASLVSTLAGEVERELSLNGGPSISTRSYSVPLYEVGPGQATVPVRLESGFSAPALRSAWSAVPLPSNAIPAAGTDGHLVVWQPSTDKLWEFWRLSRGPAGWEAAWGGAIDSVSTDSGVYGPDSWPGAGPSWGGTAAGFSVAAGLITFSDLRQGKIDHALALSLPEIRANVYSAPAGRGDGLTDSPLALPEGAHLRLNPNLNLSSLNLPPFTLELARAAQRYGIFVRDRASNVTFYAQDPTPTGTDPYGGPNGFYEGSYPAKLLSSFPWRHLQLLKMQLSASPGR